MNRQQRHTAAAAAGSDAQGEMSMIGFIKNSPANGSGFLWIQLEWGTKEGLEVRVRPTQSGCRWLWCLQRTLNDCHFRMHPLGKMYSTRKIFFTKYPFILYRQGFSQPTRHTCTLYCRVDDNIIYGVVSRFGFEYYLRMVLSRCGVRLVLPIWSKGAGASNRRKIFLSAFTSDSTHVK